MSVQVLIVLITEEFVKKTIKKFEYQNYSLLQCSAQIVIQMEP